MMNPDHIAETLARNLDHTRVRLCAAAARARRDPESIRLIAVTKYAPLAALVALQHLGQRDFGESRVQQLVARAEALGTSCSSVLTTREAEIDASDTELAPTWHMVGHLQRNKIRPLLQATRIVHSLDSLRLATALQSIAAQVGAVVDCLIEVNVAGEASKTGVDAATLPPLLDVALGLPNLRICGLMTMAPFFEDPQLARPVFAELRKLAGTLPIPATADRIELSMGMSHDFEVAIEEGATMIRIGSALFEGIHESE